MKLTPIRVRGKRGQPKLVKKTKGQGGQGKHDAGVEVHRQPERKRAKKHHGEGDDTRARRTRLHQLPQEILERIFIASHNLFLPLVNRELHHMLSSNSIKYRLVGAAFGPTWDAYYGCDNFEVMSYDGWQSDAERIEGVPEFQSAVLACSWAKLPMLLSSFDVWIRQHSKGRAYFTIPELKQDRLKMAPQPGSLYERAYYGDIDDDDDDTISSSSSPIMAMREKLAFDQASFEALISHSSPAADVVVGPGQIPLRENIYQLRAMLGMHLEVHPGARIPVTLLSGPFESDDGAITPGAEKMQRLFWLVRGGACLQEDQTWEVTREGFKQVLRLINRADASALARDHYHVRDHTGPQDRPADDAVVKTDPDRDPETGPETEPDDGEPDRLELAARLLTLFSVLGVFDAQLHWPRYIAQTSLAQVSALVARSAPGSGREALLAEVAALLRQTLGQHEGATVYRHLGRRWRLRGRHAMFSRNVHVAAFGRVWRCRAGLFLRSPGGQGKGRQLQVPPSSPIVAGGGGGGGIGGGGGLGPVMHEPWSDFGLD